MTDKSDEIRRQFRTKMNEIWSQCAYEGALFHYTDLQGLEGILGTRSLQLTNVLDMADDEFDHGREVVREVNSESADLFNLVSTLADAQRCRDVGTTDFAGSFCTDGDKQSQWCQYAAGGWGYAIEFDYASLLSFGAEANQFALIRVVCDDVCKRKIVKLQRGEAWRIVSSLLGLCGTKPPDGRIDQTSAPLMTFNDPSSDFEVLRGELAKEYIKCMALFKRWDLREEKECRLLKLAVDQPVKTRTRLDGRSLSYVEQPLGSEQIRSIVLGPRGDPEKRAEEVQSILTENGFGGVSINRSRCTP